MAKRWKADDLVLKRSENIDRFKGNFLKQVVCELRFPTLMELGEQRPPSSFVKALRKEYPHLDLSNEVTLGLGGSAGSSNIHIFRSQKSNWNVSLKQSALSIETTAYAGFDNLRSRVLRVVEAASEVIDSDFFTRVGLRYINIIKGGGSDISQWINPSLLTPVHSNTFRGINECSGRLVIADEDGGCLLQHGIHFDESSKQIQDYPDFHIDIDSFRTEVLLEDTIDAIEIMHQQVFDIFDWSLGEKARSYLENN